MKQPFDIGLQAAWLSVLLYWVWSSRRVRAPERREPRWKRFLAYWLPLIVAFNLLGPGDWFGHGLLREKFVPHTTLVYSIGLALCLAGAALAIWSRHVLGSNWSVAVELKHGHELVRRGPYRVVRHPIYSGLLLLFIGNALMVGDWRGILAVGIVLVSFWRKLRLEESWLAEHFGAAYADYQRGTRMLVPRVW